MLFRPFPFAASLAIAGLAVACSSTPPPQPPEPEPPPPPKAEVKPPPPKCESLDEKCEGGSGKKAKVVGVPFTFEPASGWTYAQEEKVSIAVSGEGGPALVVLSHDAGDSKTEGANRDAALEELVKRLELTLPGKKKVGWKKPAEVKNVGDLKVSLYQIEGAKRGDKKGPLLVFAAPLPEKKAMLGVGFVPEDDQTSADAAILQSIESLHAAAAEEEEEEEEK